MKTQISVVERGSQARVETRGGGRFDSLRSLNDRGRRSLNDRGRRSLDDRGRRSPNDRGRRSLNDRGRRSLDDRGRRSLKAAASLAAAVLLAAGLSACSGGNDDLAQQYRDGDSKGYIAADFAVHEYKAGEQPKAVTFDGTLDDGTKVSNKTYAGKVTVVNFWWAACAPCREEAPVLKKADAAFGDDVAFLGVNTYDQAATARSFAKEFGITYPSIIDVQSKSVTTAFAGVVPLSATPSTVILDAEGRPTARIVGAIPDASILESLIKTALGAAS